METERAYWITDSHAHIFPHKIADKAVGAIGDFYDTTMEHEGYAHTLLESGGKIGVKKYLVCSTATTPKQVVSINDFIKEKCDLHPEFLGFATLHPGYEDLEGEVERIVGLGLHGVKLHPDFQKFNIDDPEAIPMYRLLAEAKLPVLFHTGDDRYDFSSPKRLYHVLEQVPELTAIAAHFGGYRRWEEPRNYFLGLDNVFYDTSSSLFALPPDEAVELIHHYGLDQFLFGTDFPMWDHEEEFERFLKLPLSREEQDKILYQNFERLFRIKI